MTHSTTDAPRVDAPATARVAFEVPLDVQLRRERDRVEEPPFPAGIIVAGCVALHIVAATIVYQDLIGDLYALFDATPRLLAMEHGLVRLMAVSTFLPPVVPTVLLLAATLWVGRARRERDVARWLACAAVPLAFDTVLRALGVAIAPRPALVGDLLDLASRFSPGPRLFLDLFDVHPHATLAYWAIVCTAAAIASAVCVARALIAADDAVREPIERRRRQRGNDPVTVLQAVVATAAAFALIAFIGQLVLPATTTFFLRTFN